jgi:hypothetical protein
VTPSERPRLCSFSKPSPEARPVVGGDTESNHDVSRSYGGTNLSTAVRFASAGGTNVTWDNVLVTTTFGENVPEPSVAPLGELGLLGLLRRRA